MITVRRLLVCVVFSLPLACAPAGEGEGEGEGEPEGCLADDRAETFSKGMSHDDDGFTVIIDDASPEPPDAGLNTWTVSLQDADGEVTGADVRIQPWMPDHGHGPASVGAESEDAGTYTMEPFDLFMSGLWEISVKVGPTASPDHEVKFTFCAQG
jgi:hypothetical protein